MKDGNNLFEHLVVVKRSGQRVAFNGTKIAIAIKSAFDDVYENADEKSVNKVYNAVLDYICSTYENRKTINVEVIQDIIEITLKKTGFDDVFSSFNRYRLRRTASREVFSAKEQHKFVKAIEKIGLTVKSCKDNKPMDLIFNFGKTISQEFSEAYLLETKYVRAHEEGRIFIDKIDSYALSVTDSSHLNLKNIGGNNLFQFTRNIINALSYFKEEQYGEHTIADIDTLYENIILNEFKNIYKIKLENILKIEGIFPYFDWEQFNKKIDIIFTIENLKDIMSDLILSEKVDMIFENIYKFTLDELKLKIKMNIEYLLSTISNFHFKLAKNTVNISLGYSDKLESHLFLLEYFKVLSDNDFNNLNTVFKYRDDVNLEIFDNLLETISKNKKITILYLENNEYQENLEVFNDGIIIHQNINNDFKTCKGRIKLSQTTINLARLGYIYNYDNMEGFYEELDELLELSKNQLIQRYENQANKYQEDFEYIFDNDILFDTKKIEHNQKVRKVLRNGSLSIGFVGLLECVEALKKKMNLEKEDLSLAYEILEFMNKKIKEFTIENKLNFILSETFDIPIRQSLLGIDKALYGEITPLKKDCYYKISDYLNNLSFTDFIFFGNSFMNVCNFELVLQISKNSSKKKIAEVIKKGRDEKIKFMKVQVGKCDY